MLEFQEKFIEEAGELIQGIETELLGLENNPDDKTLIDEVFRVMHTLKGTASMFGFELIESITHHLETIYDYIRIDEMELSPECINVTFEAIDIIKLILSSKNNLSEVDKGIYQQVLQKINSIAGEHNISNETILANITQAPVEKVNKKKCFYIYYKPDEEIYFRGIMPFSIFYDLDEIGVFRAIVYLDKIPTPEDFNPDKFYLFWDIFLVTDHTLEDIEDIFLFFEDGEYTIYEVDADTPEKNNFIERYNQLKEQKLKLPEINDIIQGLMSSNKNTKSEQTFVRHDEEKLLRENAISDITNKSKDLYKKTSTIRVSANKLDYLITNVSEFITLYSQISLLSESSGNEQLFKSIQALGKLSKKLRDNALELRLVAIRELTIKMQRLIRDLSKKLNKEIEFITEGTDTELDKTIIDNLEEPLMHIIRNCMDHGIEDKETRLKYEKQASGIIRLIAFYSGASVFIQIQDDGRGIDLDMIKRKAIEKGLINENAQLTQREVYDLIFEPGFSTAESVSKVSGRGVGLDVVKQKIIELRGEIEVDSEIGLGTSFTIKLPLTLSIIDTLKVKIENKVYLVPLSTVETCMRVKSKEILHSVKNQFEYQETLLPVIVLRDEFKMHNNIPENGRIIIIKQYEKKYCLFVDEVLGDHQAVVKPMGDLHKKHEYFSGASVMGDGSLALILDTNKIITIRRDIEQQI